MAQNQQAMGNNLAALMQRPGQIGQGVGQAGNPAAFSNWLQQAQQMKAQQGNQTGQWTNVGGQMQFQPMDYSKIGGAIGPYQPQGATPTPGTMTGMQTPNMPGGAPGRGPGGQKNPAQQAQMGQQIAQLPGGPGGPGQGQLQAGLMNQLMGGPGQQKRPGQLQNMSQGLFGQGIPRQPPPGQPATGAGKAPGVPR